MTGRHMTLRCDGNSSDHLAFGGPIFYGHAANSLFNEPAEPSGNVFWPQAVAANQLFSMLDGKQRKQALVAKLPEEEAVGFLGTGRRFPAFPSRPVGRSEGACAAGAGETGRTLPPKRPRRGGPCLEAQGGLDRCALAFYQEGDLGNDQVWDCWRLEGPAFVWYFRGTPHVHVWVNVADDSSVEDEYRGVRLKDSPANRANTAGKTASHTLCFRTIALTYGLVRRILPDRPQ